MVKSQNGRVALVTGASRGIGRAVALALAAQGAHVMIVGRTQGALESVYDEIISAGGAATGVPLDLTDYAAIDRLGGVVAERWGRLDVLIGNAGELGEMTPVAHIKPENFEKTVAINLTANARLIRAFEPLLLASKAGRAVFVTSGVATNPRAFWGTYAASKAALNTLIQCWAAEQVHTSLRINLLSPGAVRTAMRAQAMPGEDPNTLPRAEDIAPLFVKMAAPTWTQTGGIIHYKDTVS